MLFAEEMNSYYNGPTFQSAPVSAVTTGGPGPPPMPMEAWKSPFVGAGSHHLAATMSNTDGHGTTDSSKLVTKWGSHPVDYGKVPQNEMPSMGATPFTPTGATYGGATVWNEPHQQQNNHHAQQQHFAQFNLSQAEAAAAMAAQAESKFLHLSMKAAPAPTTFQLQGIPQQTPSGPFTPPIDLINGQWGRGEINQCTPWNLEMNGTDPSHSGPPPSHPNYRKWDQQHRGPPPAEDGGQLFGPGGYGTVGAASGYGGGGMHVYGGGERMIPGGMPQFVGAGGRGPMGTRGWDPSGGGGANKFVTEISVAGPSGGGSHRKFAQFSGPPPPLNIIPPRHPPMFGPLHPPPLFTALNPPHATNAQFGAMGTFNLQNGTTASSIQTGGLSEDAIWQDPNGELRKWQRDTGTSIWGDPAEQTAPIQRWQQFTAEEVVAKSNLLVKEGGEMVESGWGELPPIGNSTNSGTNSNSSNNETTPTMGGTSTTHQFVGGTTTVVKGASGGATTARSNGGPWNSAVGTAEGDGQQQGWTDQQKTVSGGANLAQPHGAHYQIAQQQPQMSSSNNFVLPPATSAPSATGGQQPPSLLAMLDSNTAETADGVTQRKAISPAHQQQSGGNASMMPTTTQQGMGQTLKVSLAEELSTLGTHAMGGGFW